LENLEGEANRFPFGTDLPLGIFLDVKINPEAPSPYALIETLFRSLAGHHDEGGEGVVKTFEGLLATRLAGFEKAQADDKGQSAAGEAREKGRRGGGLAKVVRPLFLQRHLPLCQ
jgi:hypothetical protein